MSKAQVQQIIDSVRDATAKMCWIPALITALTVPDILGQVEFPEMVYKRGNRNVGRQYRAWFKRHVEHRYADETGFDEKLNAKNPYFTAKMCYALRCSMLHQGSDDIDFEYRFEDDDDAGYSYVFELRANACDSYGAIWPSLQEGEKTHKTIHVCIDVKTLCDAICDEGEKYINDAPEDSFGSIGFNLVDVTRIIPGTNDA